MPSDTDLALQVAVSLRRCGRQCTRRGSDARALSGAPVGQRQEPGSSPSFRWLRCSTDAHAPAGAVELSGGDIAEATSYVSRRTIACSSPSRTLSCFISRLRNFRFRRHATPDRCRTTRARWRGINDCSRGSSFLFPVMGNAAPGAGVPLLCDRCTASSGAVRRSTDRLRVGGPSAGPPNPDDSQRNRDRDEEGIFNQRAAPAVRPHVLGNIT